MIQRTLYHYLKRDALYYPVVTLTGPRQSGKTTLVKAAFPDYTYVSLEETENRIFLREDPRGFFLRFQGNLIIDEAQRVPDLFSYIQTEVNKNDQPGHFILTSSENLLLMEKISQSLAGRCAILHLLPFSCAELECQKQAPPPHGLFRNENSKSECWDRIRSGFYPRVHDRKIPPEIWLSDYIQTYVERDVRQLVTLGDLETFERFLSLCAGRAGQLLNFSALASDSGISVDTARRWISVLKTSFIVFLLRPHYQNFNKRVIKSPKLYFYDTGLLCHLLGIRNRAQLVTHPLRGALFENYVIGEVMKAYTHHRREPPIYFWRDQTGHEIDLLIEEAGELFPVEIKSGVTVSSSMFDGLKWWSKIAGQSTEKAKLIYGGDDAFLRNNISVCPWFSI